MKSTTERRKETDPFAALQDAEKNLGRQFVALMQRIGQRDPADDAHALMVVANEILHARQVVSESIRSLRRLAHGGHAA